MQRSRRAALSRSSRERFSRATSSSAGAAGAEALRAGALGRFQQLAPGGGNGNQTEATLLGDLLADVWKSGDTFSQHNETDQRIVQTNNCVLSTAYSDLHALARFYRDAIDGHRRRRADKKAEIAEQYFVMGYSEMSLGRVVLQRHAARRHRRRRIHATARR